LFIAMNRFRITLGREETFEELWRNRDSHLEGVPGFVHFDLLRGPSDDEATLYASHTLWQSRATFEAWTESDAFKKAHAQARAPAGTYLGHPVFEGFEVLEGFQVGTAK
jgi:heme-degrading monooxygenase HmoA